MATLGEAAFGKDTAGLRRLLAGGAQPNGELIAQRDAEKAAKEAALADVAARDAEIAQLRAQLSQ